MNLSFVLIIKLTMRMTAVHKATISAAQETTLFPVRIEPTKAVTSFLANIKPTRPTTSILRAYQVYSASEDYQEAAAHLTTL